mgnify:CR=1 FL=1
MCRYFNILEGLSLGRDDGLVKTAKDKGWRWAESVFKLGQMSVGNFDQTWANFSVEGIGWFKLVNRNEAEISEFVGA